MNKITKASWIGDSIREIWFNNPVIATGFKAGQFLVIRLDSTGERIPLTIVETKGNDVRIVIQVVGHSTRKLCALEEGDQITNVVGPLGHPSELKNFGNAVCIAGGIGAAPLRPVAVALKEQGNTVTIIEGVRSKDLLIMDDELKAIADNFILVSDDGTIGEKALVTGPLKKMLDEGKKPDYVFAVGPPVMMRAVASITREHGIPLVVSLNPIMVDGTGMCGSCRVEVGDETKFACVDGPEFDGNKVNYNLLMNRLKMYIKEEEHSCKLSKT